jgi:hypothetical protein
MLRCRAGETVQEWARGSGEAKSEVTSVKALEVPSAFQEALMRELGTPFAPAREEE